MASFWKSLFDLFSSSDNEKQETMNDVSRIDVAYMPRRSDYPNTFDPDAEDDSPGMPQIFDPALLQFSRAFRHGDPHFGDDASHHKWIDAKWQVIDHLLGIITNSKWNDHLVLRGSLLQKAWFGDDGREPGDIDWVFRPKEVGIDDSLAVELFTDLKGRVAESQTVGDAEIVVKKIFTDDIWTYERAAGKRIIFPWKAEALPAGYIQMDVVFKEDLWTDPVQTQIPTSRNSTRSVWSVDKEISLAWKLLWLETDMYPQGKDLYDATLLAENTHLSLDLLKLVLQSYDWRPRSGELSSDFPLRWEVDWENFKLEYPWVEGMAEDWKARLTEALKPTFSSTK
jgi:hypothetical protein